MDKKNDVVETVQKNMPLIKRAAKFVFYSGLENPEQAMEFVDGIKGDLLDGKIRYGNDFKAIRKAARNEDWEDIATSVTKYLDKIDITGENYDDADINHYQALTSVLDRMVVYGLVDKKVAKGYTTALETAKNAYSKAKTDSVADEAKQMREARAAERKAVNDQKAAEREARTAERKTARDQKSAERKGVKVDPEDGFPLTRSD